MNIEAYIGKIEESDSDTIVLGLFEDEKNFSRETAKMDQILSGSIQRSLDIGDFNCKLGEVLLFYPNGSSTLKRVLAVGLGKMEDFGSEEARIAAASVIRKLIQYPVKKISSVLHTNSNCPIDDAAQALVEGTLLALYSYKNSGESTRDTPDRLLVVDESQAHLDSIQKGIRSGQIVYDSVKLTRDLVNMPPNIATPSFLAGVADELASEYGFKKIIGDTSWAKERKMEAYLSVAKGAGEPPKFIVLEHNPPTKSHKTIVLVGKGITFDTGGISIKPHDNMGAMKSDMAGAGIVLGVMKAVGELDLPIRLIGIAPCTENMPDAYASRPSDIVTASNGKTIEIINTDAEGRMVLADALVFAKRYAPSLVIDLATLTGACVVALGEGVAAGVFTNDDMIYDRLYTSSKNTNERIWRLPLWDVYGESIKSDVADIKNSGGKNSGVGSSAIFLRNFVDYPWVHIDIAGVVLNKKETAYCTVGATGFGVRLISDFLKNWVY